MRRIIAALLLCSVSAMGQASYWFNNWERSGNAQQAQQYFMLPGTGINFTYDSALQHVTINGAAPYVDPFWQLAYAKGTPFINSKNNIGVWIQSLAPEPDTPTFPFSLLLSDVTPNSPGGYTGFGPGTMTMNASSASNSPAFSFYYSTAPCAAAYTRPTLDFLSDNSVFLHIWGDSYPCSVIGSGYAWESPMAGIECPALAATYGANPEPSGVYFLQDGAVALGSFGLIAAIGGPYNNNPPTSTPFGIEVNEVEGYVCINKDMDFYVNGSLFTGGGIAGITVLTNGHALSGNVISVNIIAGTNIWVGATNVGGQANVMISSTAITNGGGGGGSGPWTVDGSGNVNLVLSGSEMLQVGTSSGWTFSVDTNGDVGCGGTLDVAGNLSVNGGVNIGSLALNPGLGNLALDTSGGYITSSKGAGSCYILDCAGLWIQDSTQPLSFYDGALTIDSTGNISSSGNLSFFSSAVVIGASGTISGLSFGDASGDSISGGNVTAVTSMTLNGVTITSWPTGGGGGIGTLTTVMTNGTALSGNASSLNLIGNGISVTGTNASGQANISFTYPPINNFTSTVQSGMKVWLTAEKGVYQDYGTTLATNTGQPVKAWLDQSPNHVDLTNKPSGPASTPFYEANLGPNGYPCVYIDSSGSPSVANLISKGSLGLVSPISVFAVLKGPQVTLLDSQTSGGGNRILLQCGGSWQIFASGSGLISTVGSPPDWVLATFLYTNGTSAYRLNGRTLASAAQSTTTVQSLTLGADYTPNGASPFWLAELQIYTNVLSSATITNIEYGLRTKYNLY